MDYGTGTKGKMVSCHRCGTNLFLKYIGKGDADGGYTTWDRYEDPPEDWLYETEFGYLCPECANVFKTFMTEFIGKDKIIQKWRA